MSQRQKKSIVKICGVCGPIEQAIEEAILAKNVGYDAVLLSPGGLGKFDESYLIERTKKIASIIPVIGFYLQSACGGRLFSYDYWKQLCDIEGVVAIKVASFNRYSTLDVIRAVANSSRFEEISLYTGNDDNIVSDLLSSYQFAGKTIQFKGGLLGHWCVWTKSAVDLFNKIKAWRKTEIFDSELLTIGANVTDMNSAIFDPAHGFSGCIPGIHEVLRRQGLMQNILCLDPEEVLSTGQSEEISRVISDYPSLIDDDFIKANIDSWKIGL